MAKIRENKFRHAWTYIVDEENQLKRLLHPEGKTVCGIKMSPPFPPKQMEWKIPKNACKACAKLVRERRKKGVSQ